jgi:GNAT superfamily N-acetyltransferase
MNEQTSIPQWRAATADDLGVIDAIANAEHPGLPERPEVFAEKFNLFSTGCRVLIQFGETVGYGILHPWYLYKIPPLDSFLKRLPSKPECIFVHDVVVLPRARGHGAAERFVEIVADVAREQEIHALALISVYDTHPLWMKCGFQIAQRPDIVEKLQSYGHTARIFYMRNTG